MEVSGTRDSLHHDSVYDGQPLRACSPELLAAILSRFRRRFAKRRLQLSTGISTCPTNFGEYSSIT